MPSSAINRAGRLSMTPKQQFKLHIEAGVVSLFGVIEPVIFLPDSSLVKTNASIAMMHMERLKGTLV
jgi:hypothetical protein